MGETMQFVLDLCKVLCYWFWGFLSFFLPARQKDVSNELILITGAGSGIGRLLAFKFAELGATIVLWDINKSANDAVADEINSKTPNRAYPYKCDCSKREEIYRVAENVKKDVGDVTMLINNAGIVTGKKFFDLPDDKIELTFQVNSVAHFWTTKAFLPTMMKKNHGHIVTIASTAGLTGVNGLVDYCSSKHAAVGTHAALTTELYAQNLNGVHTTCICPYIIDTGMFQGAKSKFNWLLPMLKVEYVATKIVKAVRSNQYMLVLPRLIYFLYYLQLFMPIDAALLSSKIFGFDKVMDEFTGRQKKE